MTTKRYIAKIPFEHSSKDQIWIEIYSHIHKEEVVGFYLNTYKDLSQDSTSDTWFNELLYAKEEALDYGIEKSDWIENEIDS